MSRLTQGDRSHNLPHLWHIRVKMAMAIGWPFHTENIVHKKIICSNVKLYKS